MSVLATDQGAELDLPSREKSRYDDIEVGELEFLFSSQIYEEIIEELSYLSAAAKSGGKRSEASPAQRSATSSLTASNVMMVSSCGLYFRAGHFFRQPVSIAELSLDEEDQDWEVCSTGGESVWSVSSFARSTPTEPKSNSSMTPVWSWSWFDEVADDGNAIIPVE